MATLTELDGQDHRDPRQLVGGERDPHPSSIAHRRLRGSRVASRGYSVAIETRARRLSAVLAAAGLLLAAASMAGAATLAPTAGQRGAIIKAFGDPARAAACLTVRLAASDPAYGDVRFRNTRSCQRWAFNGTNILERGEAGRWRVLFEGSSYRCPLPRIPHRVQSDLGVCPA